MLGGYDGTFESSRLDGACPSLAVKLRGIEYGGVFRAVAPFFSRVCIRAEMDECVHFHIKPAQLIFIRAYITQLFHVFLDFHLFLRKRILQNMRDKYTIKKGRLSIAIDILLYKSVIIARKKFIVLEKGYCQSKITVI